MFTSTMGLVALSYASARSTLDPMYDEGCPHRIADKSNRDLHPETEWVTIFVSTPQRWSFSSRGNIYAIWCVPKENYNIRQDIIRYSHADRVKRFLEFLHGAYVLRLATNLSTLPSSGVRCRPHCRLAISKIQQENFQNIARLCLMKFARPSTPAVKCQQISPGLRPGEVGCGQGITKW